MRGREASSCEKSPRFDGGMDHRSDGLMCSAAIERTATKNDPESGRKGMEGEKEDVKSSQRA